MSTDYDDLLDAFLAEPDDGEHDSRIEPGEEGDPPPPVTNLDDLDLLLRRVARAQREVARIMEAGQRQHERVDDRVADLTSGLLRRIDRLNASAEAFAALHFSDLDAKVRTVKVLSGQIARRPRKVRVPDVPDDITLGVHAFDAVLAPSGKPKVAKTVVAEMCEPGPALSPPDEEGYVLHQAMYVSANEDGEKILTPVPGLLLQVPTTDKITATPTK